VPLSAHGLRFASVPYLNAKPLLEGLADEVGPVRLEVPAVLTRLLAGGEVDVALAPIVASFQVAGVEVVDAGAIATKGAVGSVLLFSKTPPAEARVVALDRSSQTSVALTRVLFRFRWQASPRFVSRAPDADLTRLDADAALLIGDPALVARWNGPPPIDLGHEWCEWTGLPFVFAAWLARTPEVASAAREPLRRAAARGRARLDAIAAAGAADLGLPRAEADDYLRRHLSFDFGEPERAAVARFREFWSQLD
jgi:predicted solute-binding protein